MWPPSLCFVPQARQTQCSQTIHLRCSTSSATRAQIEVRISVALTRSKWHPYGVGAMGRSAHSDSGPDPTTRLDYVTENAAVASTLNLSMLCAASSLAVHELAGGKIVSVVPFPLVSSAT